MYIVNDETRNTQASQWKWRHFPFPPSSYLFYSRANENDDICLFLLLHIYSFLQPMKMTTFSFSSFFIFTLFSSPHRQDHTHHLWDIFPLKNKKASHSVKFSCKAIVFPFKNLNFYFYFFLLLYCNCNCKSAIKY